jgi:hypothetical protein
MKTNTGLALIAGAILLVIGVPLGLGLYAHAKHAAVRDRIEAAIGDADPCASRTVKADVESSDDVALKQRYAARDRACAAKIAHDSCVALGKAMDGGDLITIQRVDATTAALAKRIATHSVTSADLGVTASQITCAEEVFPRLANSLANTPTEWSPPPATIDGRYAVSWDVANGLKSTKLGEPVAAMLRARGEAAATAVATNTKLQNLEGAALVCKEVRDLNVTTGPACDALVPRYDAAVRRESARLEAAQKKAQARATAAADQQDARCAALDRCLAPCLDIDPIDDEARANACEARCTARFPGPRCE